MESSQFVQHVDAEHLSTVLQASLEARHDEQECDDSDDAEYPAQQLHPHLP